jgi:hypothetical protein
MPHLNYCQQCGGEPIEGKHNSTHTIIPDVKDRSTYPIIDPDNPPVISKQKVKKRKRKRS